MEAVGLVNTDPNRYHLVFMDIIMPNLDGVSAATCIRSENHTGVPIVAMTSNIRQEDIATYFNFGKCGGGGLAQGPALLESWLFRGEMD